MHFTCHTKFNDDMKFHYYKKIKNPNHKNDLALQLNVLYY
jgi:hypothetical protein